MFQFGVSSSFDENSAPPQKNDAKVYGVSDNKLEKTVGGLHSNDVRGLSIFKLFFKTTFITNLKPKLTPLQFLIILINSTIKVILTID